MHAMRKAQNYIGQITAAIDNCIQVILQKEAQLTAQVYIESTVLDEL